MEEKFNSLLLFGNESYLINNDLNIKNQKERLLKIFSSLKEVTKEEVIKTLEEGYLSNYIKEEATEDEKKFLSSAKLKTQYIYIDAVLQIASRIDFNNFINNI